MDDNMHTTDVKNRFLELRAQGLSLARIAKTIGVSKRTLVTWNHDHTEELRAMRAIELEALQEKLLASEKSELTWLAAMLKKAEERLLDRDFKYESTADVWRIQSQIRAELRQRRILHDYQFTKSAVKDLETQPGSGGGGPIAIPGTNTLSAEHNEGPVTPGNTDTKQIAEPTPRAVRDTAPVPLDQFVPDPPTINKQPSN